MFLIDQKSSWEAQDCGGLGGLLSLGLWTLGGLFLNELVKNRSVMYKITRNYKEYSTACFCSPTFPTLFYNNKL